MQHVDLLSLIVDNVNDGIYFVDKERRIQLWNKTAEEITGYAAGEMIGKNCADTLLQHIDEDGVQVCTAECPLYETLVDGKERKARVFARHKEGHRVAVNIRVFPVVENDEIVGAIEIFAKESAVEYDDDVIANLSRAAMHDKLTSLPNRRYLESFLGYRLNEFKRFEKPLAVLYADIDNFSDFNNEYGHDAGDAILKRIANSIKRNARSIDLIGRWGGEEFLGIYLISNLSDAPTIAEKFRRFIKSTVVDHAGKLLNVTVSVGITIAQPGDTIESIVERADALMYQSKNSGKDKSTSDN